MSAIVRVAAIVFLSHCVLVQGVGYQALRLRGKSATALGSSGNVVPPISVPNEKTPIHLLISAFQDGQRCAATIFRALNKAQYQERISFSILQAVERGDVSCLQQFQEKHIATLCAQADSASGCADDLKARVHLWTIPLEDAKGPVHQRGLLSELADLSGEGSMCLNTDSHMDFVQAWDTLMLNDWAAVGNEFAVLSTYPQATGTAPSEATRYHVELCGYWLSDGVPRGTTAASMQTSERMPTLTMNWAAGESFSRCHAEKNVPADKNLMWMFDGEEVNRAVRLWTHGYDLYNPSVGVILHNYTHASQGFWSHQKDETDMKREKTASDSRLHELLSGASTAAFGSFGLGDQRTIEQFVTWSHTDLGSWKEYLDHRNITAEFAGAESQPDSHTKFCRSLERLPVRDSSELAKSVDA